MKKTVLLIRNAAPIDFGGAETYPVSLAKELRDNEWNPIIVTASRKLLEYASAKGVQTIRGKWLRTQNFSGYRILLTPLYVIWQCYLTFWYIELIRKTKADVLHIQSRDDFIAGSLAGRLLRKRVVWTDHMDLRFIFQNSRKPFRNYVGKLILWATRFADAIIIISDHEKQLVLAATNGHAGFANKIVVVKNGVIDTKATNKRSREQIFTFCIASRIVANKGIGEAIEAFNLLSRQDAPDSQLYVFGDGEDFNTFKRKAATNSRIHFFGHADNVLDHIASSDVYMLPSYQEGFSIALLEATMLGKAIIASNVDSNSEIIDDGKSGTLVPPRNSAALADAMKVLLLDSKKRSKYEKASREKYEQNFNLSTKVKKEILPLYL